VAADLLRWYGQWRSRRGRRRLGLRLAVFKKARANPGPGATVEAAQASVTKYVMKSRLVKSWVDNENECTASEKPQEGRKGRVKPK
jgi:hypothetical protein